MKRYDDDKTARDASLKSIYSYIASTASKSSWSKLETFQAVVQRGDQQKYREPVTEDAYAEEGVRRLKNLHKLLSALKY